MALENTFQIPLLNAVLSAILTVFFLQRSRFKDYRKLMLVGLFAFTAIASMLNLFFGAPFAVLVPVVGLLLVSLTFADWFEDKWLKPLCLSYFAIVALSLIAALVVGFSTYAYLYAYLGELRGFVALVLALITIGMFGQAYVRTRSTKLLIFFISVLFFSGAALLNVASLDAVAEYARFAAYVVFAVPFIME